MLHIISNKNPLSSSNFYAIIAAIMELEMLERVGRNIALAREAQGWNQQELGDQLEADQAYISKVERGKVNLTLKTLAKIADVLGQDIDYFFKRQIMVEAKNVKARRRKAA
jgi:transcriptional regulator with XRE-family HTH domain